MNDNGGNQPTKSTQERLTWLMLIGLIGLALLAGGMVLTYLWPRPQWLNLGPLSDFPPQAEPYLIEAGPIFYRFTPPTNWPSSNRRRPIRPTSVTCGRPPTSDLKTL